MGGYFQEDNEETWLQTIVDVSSQETLTFYWRVSSEENDDYLRFYIDDVLKDEISGEVDWQEKSYVVSGSGSHTLKWVYAKGDAYAEGDDWGYVDYVRWTGSAPPPAPTDWDTITYTYDPSGRRIKKTFDEKMFSDDYTVNYCYDGGNVIANIPPCFTLLISTG